LFIASRPVAIQAALPYIGIDVEDGLTTRNHSQERISYRAFSDTTEPSAEALRRDLVPYTREMERYLTVPDNLDPRIGELARGLIVAAGEGNRYDAARVIEAYFHQNFRYTLEQKSEGADPVADFLFRVREGHCEYFSTAMAVMLRTAGVATRVVNGFQKGEYNDAADVYTVRQSDAHSWVEVYFPETKSWVTFDPTPVDGRPGGSGATGLSGRLGKYIEALELFWIQYVVAYDKQEQRSLATSLRGQLNIYRQTAEQTFSELRAGLLGWWQQLAIRGESGTRSIAGSVNFPLVSGLFLLLGLLLLLVARLRRISFRALLKFWQREKKNYSVVVFYERMTKALEARGLLRSPEQTPLEFAAMTGMPEATLLTCFYNRVRYGAHELTTAEAARIEEWLRRVEQER
jgi:transglutaminase-like putative cysteine protease